MKEQQTSLNFFLLCFEKKVHTDTETSLSAGCWRTFARFLRRTSDISRQQTPKKNTNRAAGTVAVATKDSDV